MENFEFNAPDGQVSLCHLTRNYLIRKTTNNNKVEYVLLIKIETIKQTVKSYASAFVHLNLFRLLTAHHFVFDFSKWVKLSESFETTITNTSNEKLGTITFKDENYMSQEVEVYGNVEREKTITIPGRGYFPFVIFYQYFPNETALKAALLKLENDPKSKKRGRRSIALYIYKYNASFREMFYKKGLIALGVAVLLGFLNNLLYQHYNDVSYMRYILYGLAGILLILMAIVRFQMFIRKKTCVNKRLYL